MTKKSQTHVALSNEKLEEYSAIHAHQMRQKNPDSISSGN